MDIHIRINVRVINYQYFPKLCSHQWGSYLFSKQLALSGAQTGWHMDYGSLRNGILWNPMDWDLMDWNSVEPDGLKFNGTLWFGTLWNSMDWNPMEPYGLQLYGSIWIGTLLSPTDWNLMELCAPQTVLALRGSYLCSK